jgi:hypothetical protein
LGADEPQAFPANAFRCPNRIVNDAPPLLERGKTTTLESQALKFMILDAGRGIIPRL